MKEQLNKARRLAVAGITAMVFWLHLLRSGSGEPGVGYACHEAAGLCQRLPDSDAPTGACGFPAISPPSSPPIFPPPPCLFASGQTGCLSGFDAVFAGSFLAREMGAPLADLPVVTNEEGLDVDAILRIDPDLVLLASRYQDRLPELERAGLNVVVADADTLDGFSQVSTYGIFLDRSPSLGPGYSRCCIQRRSRLEKSGYRFGLSGGR